MTQSEIQLATNMHFVFGELLGQILENCNTPELLGLRLVSQQWREVATKILLKRGSLEIEFKLHPWFWECLHKNGQNTFYSYKRGERVGELCGQHLPCAFLTGGGRKELDFDKTLPNLFRLMSPPPAAASQPCGSLKTCSLPVNRFSFYLSSFMVDYRVEPQLLSFVQVFGPQLKALTLDNYLPFFVGDPSVGAPDFLLQYTPNLESLQIRYNNYDLRWGPAQVINVVNTTVVEMNTKFRLGHLKFIEIKQPFWTGETSAILKHLLKIAPRLERVFFPRLSELKVFQDFPREKRHLLQIAELELSSHDLFFDGLEILECLIAEMKTKTWNRDRPKDAGLKYLQIRALHLPPTRDRWIRSTAALLQIFQLNANSLEKIELRKNAASILHRIPGLPALPNVAQLSVGICSGSQYQDILALTTTDNGEPRYNVGNSLSALLPNLEEVELHLYHETAHIVLEYENSFPFWDEKLKRVKTYKVSFDTLLGDLVENDAEDSNNICSKILNLCPQVTSLSVLMYLSENLPVMMKSLWNLGQLTILHLRYDLCFSGGEWDEFVVLDAALTGLPKATVLAIYDNWQGRGQCEESTKWPPEDLPRCNPSLLNLTNLRKLQLDFQMNYSAKPRILISRVTAQFAFVLLPNLKVFIHLKRSAGWARCPICLQEGIVEKEKWLALHQPLFLFPKVSLAVFDK